MEDVPLSVPDHKPLNPPNHNPDTPAGTSCPDNLPGAAVDEYHVISDSLIDLYPEYEELYSIPDWIQ